jgi:hypothetical protein
MSHIENPKSPLQKLLEVMNGFTKVARGKLNTQKSVASRAQWLMSVIPVTQEAEIMRITIQGQPRQKS